MLYIDLLIRAFKCTVKECLGCFSTPHENWRISKTICLNWFGFGLFTVNSKRFFDLLNVCVNQGRRQELH